MKNILGIDVSKDTLDVCLLISNEPYYHKFQNNEDGFSSISSMFHNFKVSALGFESTGNYHKKLENHLFKDGINPYILKPLAVSNFRKSLNVHGKTDKSDSYAIARFLKDGDLTEYLSYPVRDTFKPILSSLNLLSKQLRQTKNNIHALELLSDSSFVTAQLFDLSVSLEFRKDKLEAYALDILLQKCPEAFMIKKDIKGVGDKLLIYLIPYLFDNFDKFTLKQINAFFGLNPVSFQSGTSVFKKDRLSKKGDTQTMSHLYMSAVSAVRSNEILKAKYLRLKASGKPSKVALVAVMSHLLRAIVIKLSYYTKREMKK